MMINRKILSAFSMVELLIVITIIGVLAAIAAPIYTDYVIRSRISSAMAFKDKFYKAVVAHYYEYGTFGTGSSNVKLDSSDAGISHGATREINAGNVILYHYFHLGTTPDGINMCFWLKGLEGQANYSPPVSPTNWGTKTGFCERIYIEKGSFNRYCGVYSDHDVANTFSIRLKYMPKGCRCILTGDNLASNITGCD